MPDGVLINGKGPYRYNTTFVPDGIDYETITVHPGETLTGFGKWFPKSMLYFVKSQFYFL